MPRIALLLLLLVLVEGGCSRRGEPSFRLLEPGVQVADVTLTGTGPGGRTHLWIYLPEGVHPKASLPCVFVAPAGTIGITGMELGDGDRPEHLPYVRAGFAVVAYSLDGPERARTRSALIEAISAFKDAGAGVANAKAAVDYALAHVPQLDPEHLYAAGHSSAGNVALLAAIADPRLRAVAAYAPAANVNWRLREVEKEWDEMLPGTASFMLDASPSAHVYERQPPVFLFHADDDDNVSVDVSRELASLLQRAGASVRLERVKTGGHYQAMIGQGIPAAIAWFRTQR